uniref:Uncharacterized protein n=2 Tax=Acidianus TaxID=12914 RepID=A0A2U9IQ95_9CREN
MSEVLYPILSQFKNIDFTYINYPVTFSGRNLVFKYPVVFEGPVTFNGQTTVTFDCPVVFEGPVTFNGQTTINSPNGMGIIFNGSSVTFNGGSSLNIEGPVIFNLASKSSSVTFNDQSDLCVEGPLIMSSSQINFDGAANIVSYQYTVLSGAITFNGQSEIETKNEIPPVNTNIKVVTTTLYTAPYSIDDFSFWFENIPNNINMPIILLNLTNLKIEGVMSSINFNESEFTLYVTTNQGSQKILSAELPYYQWYFTCIELQYPDNIIASVYGTSSEMASGSSNVFLPQITNITVTIAEESFSQVYVFSSNSNSYTSPISIYDNGGGYLVNFASQLEGYTYTSGEIVLYYYLGSYFTNPYPSSAISPSFAYPSSLYDIKLLVG